MACLVGDACYLRPSELLGLDVAAFCLPQMTGGAGCQHFNLVVRSREAGQASKCGTFDDAVRLDRPTSIPSWKSLLYPLLAECRRNKSEWVWPFKHKEFVAAWRSAVEILGVPQYDSPYLLRHAGPSHDRALGLRTIEAIQQRGRWSTRTSMVRYEKQSRLQRNWAALAPSTKVLATEVDRRLKEFLARPELFVEERIKLLGA